MSIATHLNMCKPIKSGNHILASIESDASDWPDLFEYQGYIAAPMVDFHNGNITAIAYTDGINSVGFAGGIKARQCGFYAGSAVQVDESLAELLGANSPLIFCTDLLTSLLLHKITSFPVMFCTDISAFSFSKATDCFVRKLSANALEYALNACGHVDVWFPIGSIESSRQVKWMDAVQAASMIEVNYDHA
jgi:hypothetical protein